MGIQKIAFNFMVKQGGKLVKSLLLSKPHKIINPKGLKYIKFQNSQEVEYLYHITKRANWLKMHIDKNNPAIMPSLDGCFGKASILKGIFTTSKENLINCWQYSNSWNGHLGFNLLKHTAKNTNNLVCLRIPIAKINKNNIVVRSQNNLFSFINRKGGNMQEAYNGFLISDINKIKSGDAIEYIYTGGIIPLENVEVVGRANAKEISKRLHSHATQSDWFNETIKDLFNI